MSARRAPLAWWAWGLSCAAVATALDAALLEATRGGFGNGFGGILLDTARLRARYAGTALVANGFAVALVFACVAPLARALTTRPHRVLAASVLAALGAAAWADVFLYQLHATIGALITPGVAMELAGHDVSSFDEAGAIAGAVLGVGGVASSIALVAGMRFADRLAARSGRAASRGVGAAPARPRARGLALVALALAFATAFALGGASRGARTVREALELQPASALLVAAVERATDVDRDGAGWLSRPPDAAPFDAALHPRALDLPGNGIDEDGVAGDLPRGAAPPAPTPVPEAPAHAAARTRPHVLVVYLESFRYDVLGRSLDGRPVTPFLDALAREGASTAHAWVHSPYTTRSRAQLFGGTLAPHPGQRTWIDDFAARGYRTAHFSGQDDSFGDSEPLLGTARADRFYDARSDTAQRTSRSTAPASLQVSWKLLLARVRAFLAEVRASDPLFLYVNVVDTHYPYWHEDLDRVLDVDPVDRSEIRAWNREAVWRTYLAAAANVDRAVEALVGSFREAVGNTPHAIVVTADHGQSIYDDGSLGHGRRLDRLQTHVPLVVAGLGGDWPEPIGAADLRGLVLRAVDANARGGVRFVPDPERRVFQYLPTLEAPSLLGWRSLDDAWIYDFARGRATHEDGSEVAPDDPELVGLLHAWESLRVATEGDAPTAHAAIDR